MDEPEDRGEAEREWDEELYREAMREVAAEEKAEADFDDAISEGRFNE